MSRPDRLESPRTTVLLPLGRIDDFTKQAVESVVTDETNVFVLLDGVDPADAAGVLDSVVHQVHIWHSPDRLGVAAILNCGLNRVETEYVARMDGDDISAPDRLSRQRAYLDANPEIGLVGTWATLIDEHDTAHGVYRTPVTHPHILRRLLLRNAFFHPSIMGRTALLRQAGGYREDLRRAEDYELWMRLSSRTKLANIPEPLISYRVHSGQVTTSSRRTHHPDDRRILLESRRQIARNLGIPALLGNIASTAVHIGHRARSFT